MTGQFLVRYKTSYDNALNVTVDAIIGDTSEETMEFIMDEIKSKFIKIDFDNIVGVYRLN